MSRKQKGSKKVDSSYKLARTAANKSRIAIKHKRLHPTDKTVLGSVPVFPPKKEHKYEVKPTMMHDIDGYYNKKTKTINVPSTMFLVTGPGGIWLEYTYLEKDVREFFRKLKCAAALWKVINNKRTLVELKRPVPLLSAGQLSLLAFGKQSKRK